MSRWLGLFALLLITSTGGAPAGAQAEQQIIPGPQMSAADARFIGHYYLSGVMETGSEMLLKADGTYDWMLVVGGLDLFSKGTWARTANYVVLTPALPDKNAALFKIGVVEPWNEAAEENAQEDAMVKRNTVKVEHCRFLATEDGGAYTDASMTPHFREITREMIIEAKRAALSETVTRKSYENAAVAAMASQTDASHQTARAARLNWRKARDHMRQAQSDARLPFERLDEPKLPADCVLESWAVRPGDIPRKDWIGGVAVHVGDAERRMYFNEVPIRFGLESGASLDRETESGGIAWVPRNLQDRVVSITVIGKQVLGSSNILSPSSQPVKDLSR